eukprot:c23447_g1_i1.p1 GENE.c23447_g1_i1~~c23447_g1_i1.p1  ORF type:complete len:272 (-),score=51.37 c23447_g1_i1:171-929(-)
MDLHVSLHPSHNNHWLQQPGKTSNLSSKLTCALARDRDLLWLAHSIESIAQPLLVLTLAGNQMDSPVLTSQLKAVLDHVLQLTSLDLSNCNLQSSGLSHIISSLAQLSNLQTLNVSTNSLGPEGARHLGRALVSLRHVTWISLSSNRLMEAGMSELRDSIAGLPLTHLNLHANDMGPKGALHLASAIAQTPNITWLNITYNNIGALGMLYLLPRLTKLHHLTHLNLWTNDLQDEMKGNAYHQLQHIPELRLW